MDELADFASLVGDPAGLRRRLAGDGYLFFRGLLPADEIRAAGQAVLARLRAGGWADGWSIPPVRPRAVNPIDALADPAFRAAVTSGEFNRIPYLPQLRAVIRTVLGSTAFSYPRPEASADRLPRRLTTAMRVRKGLARSCLLRESESGR